MPWSQALRQRRGRSVLGGLTSRSHIDLSEGRGHGWLPCAGGVRQGHVRAQSNHTANEWGRRVNVFSKMCWLAQDFPCW